MAVRSPEEDKRVGARLRSLRAAQGVTMVELLARIDGRLSQASLSMVENGRSSPKLATLTAVADALGLDLIDLVADPARGGLHRLIDGVRLLPPESRADFLKQLEHDLEDLLQQSRAPKKRRTSRRRSRKDVPRASKHGTPKSSAG